MQAIPDFPDFTPLTIHHKQIVEEITRRFPSYSDFNFISLFSWDTEADIALSILNTNLVVLFSDYDDSSLFLSFIGTHRVPETLATLFTHCKEHNLPNRLSLVPHSVVKALEASNRAGDFVIKENRDNHDYILSVKQISEYGQGDYQRKRKAVNRFNSRHGDRTWHGLLNLNDPQVLADIRTVMDRWRTSRKRRDAEDEKEFVAINRTLEHARQLEVEVYGIRVDNELVAFTLFELAPQKDVAVFHFTKADARLEGVFEFLKHHLAKYLTTLGVEYINIEQDLGVEGLRTAKESYKPIHFLQKYTIEPKAGTI